MDRGEGGNDIFRTEKSVLAEFAAENLNLIPLLKLIHSRAKALLCECMLLPAKIILNSFLIVIRKKSRKFCN